MDNRSIAAKELLSHIQCFVLDLDGTLYLGEQWITGALDFVNALRASGRRVLALTNNSSHSRAYYCAKLRQKGLLLPEANILTSGRATMAYLHRVHAGQAVFLLGNRELREEFAQGGIPLCEAGPQVVVTAYDTELSYEKLVAACGFLRQGLPFIATHPDINCPSPLGPLPDIGAVHALLAASTGRRPDVVIGKPEAGMVDYLLAKTGLPAEQTAVVGDRLYTDIAMGARHGLLPVLVLSGETQPCDIAASLHKPALVFPSVREIIPYL